MSAANDSIPRLRIQYSPTFVENTVIQATYGDRKLESRLHRAIDPLYRLPEGRDRERRFSLAYWELFLQLELNHGLASLIEERPVLTHEVSVCLVHEAPGSRNEGADLLVREAPKLAPPDRRTLAIQVRPASVLDEKRLSTWARRELLHVADMLDPVFAYEKWRAEPTSARDNLVRDRYRVLWDTWVEARLIRERRSAEGSLVRIRGMMDRAFSGFGGVAIQGGINHILTTQTLTHDALLDWAREPETLLGKRAAVDDPAQPHPEPGEPCPLCGFSTFDWFDFQGERGDRAARAVHEARPSWRVDQGACRQCAEIYACSSVPLA